MSHLSRYNTRLAEARNHGDPEKETLWIPSRTVIEQLLLMREGDTLVIDHVGDAEEGVEYA